MKFVLCFLLLGFMSGCSFFFGSSEVRNPEPGLSETVAKSRGKLISGVSYDLQFTLGKSKNYQGQSKIQFNLKKAQDITLDFFKGEIKSVTINQKQVSQIKRNDYFLTLEKKYLKKGENQVVVDFTQTYSKDGVGLYRYVDPEDQRIYTYTDFEPYDANRMFPCFDQPDLKASFATVVYAPMNWEVISSTRETSKDADKNGMVKWTFPKSEIFSTYVYALHAGEYTKWESSVKTPTHVIPLRLFARKSLAPFVKINDWFVPAQQGFNFFEDYFSYAYPYQKYDMVIVPDFISGAMENVAAVTFNEDRFVFRGEKLDKDRRRLANVILHEMAHMWFGDLVTMKWWNDLWLNESFATFMANRAMVEVSKDYKDNWMNFFTRTKAWAYQADQAVTTHPIETEVPSTMAAMANFDGITYGKGASALKQMAFYLGEEKFKEGLAIYFARHANKNTELKDFMAAMSEVAGRDMEEWQNLWLKTASLNTIEVDFQCDGEIVSELTISQTGDKNYPTMRPHKTQLALLKKDGENYRLDSTVVVEYDKEKTDVPEGVGKPCPDIIYPNYQDHDYVQVQLDEKTVTALTDGISKVKDDFLRTMMWADLWEMVLDQKMSVSRYLQTVKSQGLDESVVFTQRFILEAVERSLNEFLPREGELAKQREQWVAFFEKSYLQKIKENKGNAEQQKFWFDHYAQVVESNSGLKRLARLLQSGRDSIVSFDLDQDRRWEILTRLASFAHSSTDKLFAAEKKRDTTKRGQQLALVVEAVQPQMKTKKTFFARVSQGAKVDSLGNLRAIMERLFPAHQRKLHRQFSEDFYTRLKSFNRPEDMVFVRYFTESLAPSFCDKESASKMEGFVKAEKLPAIASKILKIHAQENSRCQSIREKL